MPTKKAPGKDKVSMRIIKDCLLDILGPLTNIINASMMSSDFQQSWKEAEVIPLIREGDYEIPSNNRPLFLLMVVHTSPTCKSQKPKYLLIGTRQLLQNLPSDMSLNFVGEIITPAPAAK